MRAGEAFQLASNAAAGTYGPVYLLGGKYQLSLACTGTPSAQLNQMGADGVTYEPVGSAVVLAGVTIYDLPPGQYQLVVSTSTANYARITRIPEE